MYEIIYQQIWLEKIWANSKKVSMYLSWLEEKNHPSRPVLVKKLNWYSKIINL